MAFEETIARRGVFYVGGYDPKAPDAFFARLDKERARYGKLWGVETVRGAIRDVDGVAVSTVTANRTSKARPWKVETDVHFFSLEDIVQRDFADPIWKRLFRYSVTLQDYVLSGTMFAFFRTNWRFALYFLYPITALMVLWFLTWIPFQIIASFFAIDTLNSAVGMVGLLAGAFASVLAYLVLIAWVSPRWFVPHLMDLWSFSRNWIRQRRPDARALFDRYGEVTAKAAASGGYDEIVLVGHSTGGALILEIAHAALTADPIFSQSAPRVTILTVGSTALKIGLHPAAGHFREKVQDTARRRSFLGRVPGADRHHQLRRHGPGGGDGHPPHQRGFRPCPTRPDPVHAGTGDLQTHKNNPFRVHYQFVFANTAKTDYDFHSICFGPLPLLERMKHPNDVVEHLNS